MDVHYYIAMGESAYGYLADTPSTTNKDRALETIYSDLASHFSMFTSLISLLRTNAENWLPTIDSRPDMMLFESLAHQATTPTTAH